MEPKDIAETLVDAEERSDPQQDVRPVCWLLLGEPDGSSCIPIRLASSARDLKSVRDVFRAWVARVLEAERRGEFREAQL